jgi:prepilin-type N-terminal cleavage/methylation domain-containing protein
MKRNGFTLVEVLIAMAVGLIIMAAIYAVMNMAQHSASSVDRKVLTQGDARAVLNLMAMEIRMASFNRLNNNAVWATVPSAVSTIACTEMGLAAAVTARKGIQRAENNSILIAMDLNANGVIDGTNEYIFYNYNSATGVITRNVSCGGNQPILGGAGSSTMVVNAATAIPMFQYFNESGTDISAAVVAVPNVNIPLIRRIRINIVAGTEAQGRINVNTMTYSTDVLVRNHVLSP